MVEDFSAYVSTEDLLRYPNPIWSGRNEDVNRQSISLDQDAPPVGGQSMRYTFASRAGNPNLCRDYTIGRNIRFPRAAKEVWLEAWFKFSPGWETMVPQCRGRSANAYKLLFARVRGRGRFAVTAGVMGARLYTIEYPGKGPAFQGRGPGPIQWSAITDGRWHLIQQHLRVSSNPLLADGYMETRIDGVRLNTLSNIIVPVEGIVGIALGRNLNQGPLREQSLWWGRIRVWNEDPAWGF
ncbi:MAG: hypothetical protein AB7R55_09475 [Gemmatimonadales bacterium]